MQAKATGVGHLMAVVPVAVAVASTAGVAAVDPGRKGHARSKTGVQTINRQLILDSQMAIGAVRLARLRKVNPTRCEPA